MTKDDNSGFGPDYYGVPSGHDNPYGYGHGENNWDQGRDSYGRGSGFSSGSGGSFGGSMGGGTGEWFAPSRPGVGSRLVAFIIDSILFGIVFGVLMMVLALLNFITMPLSPFMPTSRFSFGGLLAGLISLFGFLVYRAGMESSDYYQGSIGRILLGQRVVDINGDSLTFSEAIQRNGYYILYSLIRLIPFGGFFGLIYIWYYASTITNDQYNQSQSDAWAGAYIIRR